jgi:FkbM family methyltransferase
MSNEPNIDIDAGRLWASLNAQRKRLLSVHFKKLVRSTQIFFPSLPDVKFSFQARYYRVTRRLFKVDFEGLRHLPLHNQLLLDIGANRGQSIIAFKNAVPSSRIIAFEPNSIFADRLAQSYAGDETVKVEACALASAPGSLMLYVPSYNGFLFDGLSSINREEADGWFSSERFFWFDRSKVTVAQINVPTRTLDSYSLAPALIKLSVQRAEIEVLKGARNTLETHRPVVLCAYPWPDLINFLAKHGYRPHAYEGGKFVVDRLGIEFTWFFAQTHIALAPCAPRT